DGLRSTPRRSRTVLSYSTLFSRCATTRPGLIGPVAPGGSTVDPAVPAAPPVVLPTLPVQPTTAAAIAVPAAVVRAARATLHEGKPRRASTSGGIGRRFLSNEYAASASSVVPLSGRRAKKGGQPGQ